MTDVLNVLNGGGELGIRMRSLNWANTPLGSPNTWPQSLQSAIGICINSRFPIAIYWGAQLALLYNDAWSPILGEKHPRALGRPGREVWPEIWAEIGPLFDSVQQTGEGVWQQDQLLPMHRHGYTEECYFNFTFSPISGEDGSVVGIFNAVIETTFRVIEERRAQILRDISEHTAGAKSAAEVCTSTARALDSSSADVPFCLFYVRENDTAPLQLVASAGTELPSVLHPLTLDPHASDDQELPWPAAAGLHTPQGAVIDELSKRFGLVLPSGIWPESVERAIIMPIPNVQATEPVGLFIAGISPRRALDEAYHTFIQRITLHLATTIGNVRTYEAERQRAETLAMLDQAKTIFFSNISHEFRTPLTLLLGPLEDTLAQSDSLPDETRERLQVAHRNGLRLLKLVNTLLDFSRIEAGRAQASYEPTDLAAFTADLASVFRSTIERAGLRLIVSCPALAEFVYIDHEMWEKIVFNLLSNAFKFTFVGEIEVSLRQIGATVELMVRDTGIGIPAEEIPHLFERFYRIKGVRGRTFEGSGIGLALVQELVKLHSGAVYVESEENQGTIFTVAIPTGTAHLPADRMKADPSRPPINSWGPTYVEEALRWLPNEDDNHAEVAYVEQAELASLAPVQPPALITNAARILLADDNADMREYIRRLLSQKYAVIAVQDGAAALRVAREQPFDLVLADVMMPHVDGFGLLAALRAEERTKALPIILLSARAGEESRAEGMEAGADDYLIKPFSARELLARIGAHLTMARIRREAAQRERELINEAQAAKTQLERVLASVSDQFLALDHNWQYVFVNDRVTEVTGLPREQLLGKNMWELFPETVGTQLEHELRRAMAEQVPVQVEYFLAHRNRWFENRAYPSESGQTLYIADITERKHRELNAAFLSDITANLALLTNSDEMLRTVSEHIADHLHVSRCLFCEVEQENGQVTIFHEYHEPGLMSLNAEQRATEWVSDEFWHTLIAGHNVMIHDVAADQRTAPGLHNLQHASIGSCVVAPGLSGGRLKFMLVVSHTQPHQWHSDEQYLIHEVALRIWLSYDRARAEAELRANTIRQALLLRLLQGQRETSNPDVMLAAAAEAAGRFLGANRVGFFDMRDDDTLQFTISWTDGGLEPLSGTFPATGIGTRYLAEVRAGRTLGIADTASNSLTADSQFALIGARSIIGVPIIRNGRWHAGFYVNHATVRHWTDAEITLICDVGEQTWDAVERARAEAAFHTAQAQRLAEEQQYAERLRQLNAAAVEINAALSVEEVLHQTVQKARMLIGTNLAVVNLASAGDWAQVQTVVSPGEQAAAMQNGNANLFGEELFRLLSGERRTLRLTQAQLAEHLSLAALQALHGVAAEPMLHSSLNGVLAASLTDGKDALIGLIQLSDKIVGQFTLADEALLQQFAQMASVALENQALYAQEQALRTQAEEASRLKDEFLATVSHELRTPLTALLGYSQLLQSRKRDETYIARTAEKLVRSAKDQALIIDDLLDVSRIVSGKLRIEPEPTDLIAVVHAALDTIRPAIDAKELHLQVDLHTEAGMIVGDANRLQQIVWNLLSNATKFTPPGGSIQVRLEPHGRNAQLTIRDTGQGIPRAFLPFVFDRFRQADSASNRSHGGLGLGLAIVRHLVELHGGTVQAASDGEDQGSTFTIRLPLAATGDMKTQIFQPADEDNETTRCPPELHGLRILVVDDQLNILELLHEILASCGAVVQTCNNAREALTLLHDWQPEVLVSDIAMPHEDGYWLIRHVRALAPENGGAIPAIALTAYVRMEEQVRVLAAGFHLYVPKPIKPTELRNVIAHLVRMETQN